MADYRSCGVLIFRDDPTPSFLLMKHHDRWDLPKGHLDAGESDLECALRELEEETGIQKHQIKIDPQFLFVYKYVIDRGKKKKIGKQKELIMFLGQLIEPVEIVLTEHIGFEWVDWNPPHTIQERTIDPLLTEVQSYIAAHSSMNLDEACKRAT